MTCSKHGCKMVQLFVSWVCDECDNKNKIQIPNELELASISVVFTKHGYGKGRVLINISDIDFSKTLDKVSIVTKQHKYILTKFRFYAWTRNLAEQLTDIEFGFEKLEEIYDNG